MPAATKRGGKLIEIPDCYIKIGGKQITMNNLPDISDSKSTSYADEAVIGRSFPIKTFSHSENRSISWTVHFHACDKADLQKNLDNLRLLESALYPRAGTTDTPYKPPPICKLKCGKCLADKELCAVLKQYSLKLPTDVAWHSEGGATMMPWKFDVDLTFDVVYNSQSLPNQEQIVKLGG